MRAWSLLLVVVLAVAIAAPAWGDIAPLPGPGPRPGPVPPPYVPPVVRPQPLRPAPNQPAEQEYPLLDENTQVAMNSAEVNVQLMRLPVGAKRGESPERVLAAVTCTFNMECVAAKRSPTPFVMAFPVDRGEASELKVTRFAVEIDGKTPIWIRTQKWRTTELRPEEQWYNGYTWPASMSQGDKRTVTVRYSLMLPVKGDAASFTYILRTGAAWHGPIGLETIRVKADQGLEIEPARSPTLQSERQADGTLVWQIKDAEPTDDVRVAITLLPGGGIVRTGR